MNKSISTILAALFLGTSPLSAAEALPERKSEERVKSNFYLGSEAISLIRDAYEKGFYEDFLMQMDADYLDALAANSLDGLLDTRKEKPMDTTKWEERLLQIQQQRNEALRALLASNTDSILSKKIGSVAADVTTPSQEEALHQLGSFAYMSPGSGKNADENLLIDLDLEYEYKLLHLNAMNLSLKEKNDKQVVLKMDKMRKLQQAAKNFSDESLKRIVELSAENFDKRLAQNWDARDLNTLANGTLKPVGHEEAAVASILTAYQTQIDDLLKEIAR